MKTFGIYLLFLAAAVTALPTESATAQPAAKRSSSRDSRRSETEGIAVSLRALSDSNDEAETTSLFGATRLRGFLLVDDELGADCILVLEKERRRPLLRLDDLAIAYRNIVEADARPACTIDPRAETLAKLAEIGQRIGSQQNESSIQQQLREFERVGKGPQDVQVFNVNPESHFASVMVLADYDLKSICNGATTVNGIASLTDRLAQQVQDEIVRTGTCSIPTGSQNRFWFNPGRVSYRTDGSLFLLNACEVTLLTEEEAITPDGARAGLARPNPLASEFAADLTQQFAELSRDKPIFRELENLYRAVAAMSLIVSEGELVHELVEDTLSTIDVPKVPFKKTLAGRVLVKKLQGSVSNGTYTLWLPSCGGVSIDIDPRTMTREDGADGELSNVTRRIVDHRPTSRTASWKIQIIE